MSLLDCTAVELAAKIKAGEVTAVEAMQAVVAPFVGTVVAPFVGAVEGFVDTAGADETSAVGVGVAKASLTTRAQSFPPDNLYVVPSISVFVPI